MCNGCGANKFCSRSVACQWCCAARPSSVLQRRRGGRQGLAGLRESLTVWFFTVLVKWSAGFGNIDHSPLTKFLKHVSKRRSGPSPFQRQPQASLLSHLRVTIYYIVQHSSIHHSSCVFFHNPGSAFDGFIFKLLLLLLKGFIFKLLLLLLMF